MAPLVAFRCCLIMYNCSLLYVAENKLVVVVADRSAQYDRLKRKTHITQHNVAVVELIV